jgi:hypothetical protein
MTVVRDAKGSPKCTDYAIFKDPDGRDMGYSNVCCNVVPLAHTGHTFTTYISLSFLILIFYQSHVLLHSWIFLQFFPRIIMNGAKCFFKQPQLSNTEPEYFFAWLISKFTTGRTSNSTSISRQIPMNYRAQGKLTDTLLSN